MKLVLSTWYWVFSIQNKQIRLIYKGISFILRLTKIKIKLCMFGYLVPGI